MSLREVGQYLSFDAIASLGLTQEGLGSSEQFLESSVSHPLLSVWVWQLLAEKSWSSPEGRRCRNARRMLRAAVPFVSLRRGVCFLLGHRESCSAFALLNKY